MIIGIDVGGTFTDAVLLDSVRLVASAKRPTQPDDVGAAVLAVLDDLLKHANPTDIERLVLSTTTVTNLLLNGQGAQTALILLPGPGMPTTYYQWFDHTWCIRGAIDFRGRELEAPDEAEIRAVLGELRRRGIKHLAICGKFSNRNPRHELLIKASAEQYAPEISVTCGVEVAAALNYPRRIVTTYYSVKVRDHWRDFIAGFEHAIRERSLNCSLNILKADGGTMTVQDALNHPCEALFTGPAASVMGGMALQPRPRNAAVIDIGGTSTDISLLIEGQPLYASKGIRINGRYSHVRSFAQRSLALGGDTPVDIGDDGDVILAERRLGPARCWGGAHLTLTDIYNYRYQLALGDASSSRWGIEQMAQAHGISTALLCEQAEMLLQEKLKKLIGEMFDVWQQEPAYRIWEIVNQKTFRLDEIIGIGAAAGMMVPALAESLGADCVIRPLSPVANALGAALARPTMQLHLHIDTERGEYHADQGASCGKISGEPRRYQMEDAEQQARQCFAALARERGMPYEPDEIEFTLREQFNVIRSSHQFGKIFELELQLAPALLPAYMEVTA
ncbi:MAG: hydantoinase/oxoprolinase family protein [Syntrophomonadaceae bacterium]|nr:hydantoinase/oxoprolinase family protein [Syntrophomonadaceae bacterium]